MEETRRCLHYGTRSQYDDYRAVRTSWLIENSFYDVSTTAADLICVGYAGRETNEDLLRYILIRGRTHMNRNNVGESFMLCLRYGYLPLAKRIFDMYPRHAEGYVFSLSLIDWRRTVDSCMDYADSEDLVSMLLGIRPITERKDILDFFCRLLTRCTVPSVVFRVVKKTFHITTRDVLENDQFPSYYPRSVLVSFPDITRELLVRVNNPYKLSTASIIDRLWAHPTRPFAEHALRVLRHRKYGGPIVIQEVNGKHRDAIFKAVARHEFLLWTPLPVSNTTRTLLAKLAKRSIDAMSDVVDADTASVIVRYLA